MSEPHFIFAYDPHASYDLQGQGRCYMVRLRQNWHEGRYLHAVAENCTKEDAENICNLLNAQRALKCFEP